MILSRICNAFIVAAVVCNAAAASCTVAYAEDTATGTYGVLTYTKYTDYIEITGCDTDVSGTVEIPERIEDLPVTLIGVNAFSRCDGMEQVILPDSVTTIGINAFTYCYSLEQIILPDSLTAIGSSAFRWCKALSEIWIPGQVSFIGNDAFSDCSSLTAYTVSADNTTFCSVDGVLFNSAMTRLIDYPVAKAGTEYTVPDSVTRIGEGAFSKCSQLSTINLPDCVTTFDNHAFSYCSNLTGIEMPAQLKTMGYSVFFECDRLETLTLPNYFTTLGNVCFFGCESLTRIDVDAANTTFCSIDGILFTADQRTLVAYPNGRTDTHFIVPENVTTIAEDAFSGCDTLTKVTFPDSVTLIGESAFSNCDFLAEVILPDTLTTIENSTFYGCESLSAITIPETVTTIGDHAFFSTALTEITIPSAVTSLGDSALSQCSGLEKVTILNPACTFELWTLADYEGVLYGYDDSTAEDYARYHDLTFESLGTAPGLSTPSAGDINEDGQVSVADAVLLMRCITESDLSSVSAAALDGADMDSDGLLTIGDACIILTLSTEQEA